MSDSIPARLFEFHGGGSDKFWEITLDETSHTVRYGRSGTDGQSKTKDFADNKKAKASYDKLIDQKVKKGYAEVADKSEARTEKIKAGKEQAKEHEPFIQGILENPDDLAAFGVYADWLEERGDPRGEFINIQIQLEDESLKAADRKKLQTAEKSLLKKHSREWIGEELAPYLIDNKDGGRISWERGKIQTFEFARGFLDTIKVRVLMPEFGKALRNSPHAKTLRHLIVEDVLSVDALLEEFEEYEDKEWDEESENPSFQAMRGAAYSNLRSFICEGEGMSIGVDLDKLIKKMPRLEVLKLETRELDPEKIFKIKLPELRVLKVYHQMEYPLDVLAKNKSLTNLEEIDFFPHAFDYDTDDAYITTNDMLAICKSKTLTNLKRIHLISTGVGNEGLQEIIKSGLLKKLTVLDLHYGCITDESAELLLAEDLSHLELLDLGGNYLSTGMVKKLKATGVNLLAKEMFKGEPDDDERIYLAYGDME